MRRIETYVGVQVYEWFFSAQAQYNMVGLAKLSSALLGNGPIARGLLCAPTAPASMTVQIGKGEVYQQADLEATPCGTLPADTTDQILKQGIQLGTFTSPTFAAPTTSGQSINYLLEAQYQDEDLSLDPTTGTSPVVELFYNSDNPLAPWSGPNDSGAPSNTFRDGIVAWQIKPGAAAATGSQVTPTPDAGWSGLWVVTVPFGATTLTSTNINPFPGSSRLPADILPSIVSGALQYGVDSGTANTVQASFPLPSAMLTDNQPFWVKIKAANTGATTFTPNLGVVAASPVVGMAGTALQGGELPANGRALFIWRADITSYVLAFCIGGALQVAPATQSEHAVQLGQVAGVVGQVRNLAGSLAAAATSISLTADEIIVESALGGLRYCLPSFNKTLTITGTGAGGMDTGSAPASGWLGIYAIYNPITATAALLGVNGTSTKLASVYGGANMPAGYTASALLAVVPTSASSQIVASKIYDRRVDIALSQILTTTTQAPTPVLLNSGLTPNARRAKIVTAIVGSAAATVTGLFSGNAQMLGESEFATTGTAGGNFFTTSEFNLDASPSMYYQATVSAGTIGFNAWICSYEI